MSAPMPDLVEGLALHVAQLGHGVYRRGSAYQPGEVAIVLGGVIPDPEQLLAITEYVAGGEPDSLLPFAEPSVQWRFRGTGDESVSRRRAWAAWSDLHGAGPLVLPNEVLVLSVIAAQPPTPLGRDEAGRHEHVFNTRVEFHCPTAHRAPL